MLEHVGININCKSQDFIRQILSGLKVVETRDTASLTCYVGRRVGLIQTGKGKARLMGYATITEEICYNSVDEFRADEDRHCVLKGSKYDIKDIKYGYVLSDVVACNPMYVLSTGIKARDISEMYLEN